jgi:hypothetical protein
VVIEKKSVLGKSERLPSCGMNARVAEPCRIDLCKSWWTGSWLAET